MSKADASMIHHRNFIAALWSPAGKGLASWLSCMLCFIVFCHFPMWCPGPGVILFDLILYVSVNNLSVTSGQVFLHGLNQYLARINVSCSRTQHNDAGEARNAVHRSRAKHSTTEPLRSLVRCGT